MNPKFTLLTQKQKKFYEFIKSWIEKRNQAPTIQEMMRGLELSSPRAVTQYLDSLEKKGLISRERYGHRGIELRNPDIYSMAETVTVPVIGSAGCDNVNLFAERTFGEFICISKDLLEGARKESIVCIRAVGDSMEDAGINDGDHVLAELTEAVTEGDLVVAVVDGNAVIKKLEMANNAIILKPVSSNPIYRPIILNKSFKIFGKVVDIIRMPQKGDLEIVPIFSGE